LTISGMVGQVYGIQSCSNLTTLWQGLTNLTLNAPTQVWYDPQPMSLPQRYYRVVSGPISIP